MQTIKTVPEFLLWAEQSIRTAKPHKEIPCGFLHTFHDLFDTFSQIGHIGFGSDTESWCEYLDAVFNRVRTTHWETESASPATLEFISQIYGRAMSNGGGDAAFCHLVEAVVFSLGLDDEDLQVVKRVFVGSTSLERRFDVQVSIPLPRGLDMLDGQVVYQPPWGRAHSAAACGTISA